MRIKWVVEDAATGLLAELLAPDARELAGQRRAGYHAHDESASGRAPATN